MAPRILSLLICLISVSCGYHFREAENVPFKQYNVRRIYLIPPNNMMTYSSGLELRLFNALKKRFEASGQIEITENRDEANAFLHIDLISGGASGGGVGDVNFGNNAHKIYTSQSANVSVRLWLEKNEGKIGLGSIMFKKDYSSSATYQAFPVPTTEPMVATHIGTESEQERGLSDAVDRLALDAELNLLRLF